MKSISTELVNDWKQKHLISFCDCESNYIRNRAKQHSETCQTIIDGREVSLVRDYIDKWCESEIKILKDVGLI